MFSIQRRAAFFRAGFLAAGFGDFFATGFAARFGAAFFAAGFRGAAFFFGETSAMSFAMAPFGFLAAAE